MRMKELFGFLSTSEESKEAKTWPELKEVITKQFGDDTDNMLNTSIINALQEVSVGDLLQLAASS